MCQARGSAGRYVCWNITGVKGDMTGIANCKSAENAVSGGGEPSSPELQPISEEEIIVEGTELQHLIDGLEDIREHYPQWNLDPSKVMRLVVPIRKNNTEAQHLHSMK